MLALFLLVRVTCSAVAVALATLPPFPAADPLFSAAGHWIDTRNGSTWTPDDARGDRLFRETTRWGVDAGCQGGQLRRFACKDILECLEGETVTIWGDSTPRVLYYGLIWKLAPEHVTDKHANRVLTFPASAAPLSRPSSASPPSHNATFEFRWDPVLGSNTFSSFRPFLSSGTLPPLLPTATARPPRLLVFSTGLWYIDPRPGMYPQSRVPAFKRDVGALLALAARWHLARVLVLAEIERPVESKDVGGFHPLAEVDEVNDWLRTEVAAWREREGMQARTKVVLGSVFNAMIANLSANTPDGLHYDRDMAEEQADVLLNSVCGPHCRRRGMVAN
ncbi:hypothetical protein JCM3770_002082 [Rhodotorula araucariae]